MSDHEQGDDWAVAFIDAQRALKDYERAKADGDSATAVAVAAELVCLAQRLLREGAR